MKRFFIFISSILFALFFVWLMNIREHAIRYNFYPSVHVQSVPENSQTEHKRVKETLNRLAQENNSIIARRISKINDQVKAFFIYEPYGGELPNGFTTATQQEADESGLTNAYLIVKGNLDRKLYNKL